MLWASLILGIMELPEENHTKSVLDWIGDTTTVIMLLPVAILMSVLLFVYFSIKLPIWWLMRKIKRSKW